MTFESLSQWINSFRSTKSSRRLKEFGSLDTTNSSFSLIFLLSYLCSENFSLQSLSRLSLSLPLYISLYNLYITLSFYFSSLFKTLSQNLSSNNNISLKQLLFLSVDSDQLLKWISCVNSSFLYQQKVITAKCFCLSIEGFSVSISLG